MPNRQNTAGRVLVVEDNAVNRLLTVRFLSRLGFDTAQAGNGRIALDILAADRFHLVLMDIQMPVMDGLEATRAIRRAVGDNPADLPVVALTAHTMESDLVRIEEAGIDEVLGKPVDLDHLGRVVARFLHAEG